jgi:hypothetical protein
VNGAIAAGACARRGATAGRNKARHRGGRLDRTRGGRAPSTRAPPTRGRCARRRRRSRRRGRAAGRRRARGGRRCRGRRASAQRHAVLLQQPVQRGISNPKSVAYVGGRRCRLAIQAYDLLLLAFG